MVYIIVMLTFCIPHAVNRLGLSWHKKTNLCGRVLILFRGKYRERNDVNVQTTSGSSVNSFASRARSSKLLRFPKLQTQN